MIDLREALRLVASNAAPLPLQTTKVTNSLGMILGEDIASDVDSPPYEKSLVDGYAVRKSDLASGVREFEVVEQVNAGQIPKHEIGSGQATFIMTGAPMPTGADAVIMVERTENPSDSDAIAAGARTVKINDPSLPESGNRLAQGAAMRKGQIVLRKGDTIRAIEIGLLSEVGRIDVSVFPRPTVSIVSTGDELTAPNEPLRPGMIRNSNGPMLDALVREAGGVTANAFVARDREAELHESIEASRSSDVVILSGGVSAGAVDLVPKMLSECGVENVFHKVRLKPGKPIWFGIAPRTDGAKRLVFGLPGNPVSALVGFQLFVAPAMAVLSGRCGSIPDDLASSLRSAVLEQDHLHRSDRPTLHPASCTESSSGEINARVLKWRGSADLCALASANCLVFFPAGEVQLNAGDAVQILSLGQNAATSESD